MDIDDTLTLERDYVRSGFRAVGEYVFEQRGVSGFDRFAWALFEQGVRGTTFDRALQMAGTSPDSEFVRELVAVYRCHEPTIELQPDASRFVRAVAGRRPLAIISDGPQQSQELKVRTLQLDRWFNPIILTDTLGRSAWKPSTVAYELIERHFGTSGGENVYIGDNASKDFVACNKLGWESIWLRRGEAIHDGVPVAEGGAPKHEVELLDGALQILGL